MSIGSRARGLRAFLARRCQRPTAGCPLPGQARATTLTKCVTSSKSLVLRRTFVHATKRPSRDAFQPLICSASASAASARARVRACSSSSVISPQITCSQSAKYWVQGMCPSRPDEAWAWAKCSRSRAFLISACARVVIYLSLYKHIIVLLFRYHFVKVTK